MKKVLFVMFLVGIVSLTQASIYKFEAEDDYSVSGSYWTTIADPAASGGKYITGSANFGGNPPPPTANIRVYSFAMAAGTYDLYIRYYKSNDGGEWYLNDSFFYSDSSLAENAAFALANNTAELGLDSVTTHGSYGWVNVDTDYVMTTDGTAYFKMAPREDGWRFDAFAFVTKGQTVTDAQLTNMLAGAHDPYSGEQSVLRDLSDRQTPGYLSWQIPQSIQSMNILSQSLYLDPNQTKVLNRDNSCLVAEKNLAVNVEQYNPAQDFAWSTDYYWTIVIKYNNGASDPNVFVHEGTPWTFKTIGAGPELSGTNLITSLQLLPATVSGTVTDATGDVASVAWEVVGSPYKPDNTAVQMTLRDPATYTSADPDLLQDWIGTDTRVTGNPMVLTLSGLPAGSYTWTSTHHDPENQTGQFNVTIKDANGQTTYNNIDISDSSITDQNLYTRFTPSSSIVSNGSDVVLTFDKPTSSDVALAFFVMNSFVLTNNSTGNKLLIDFGRPDTPVKSGYQAYKATHEVPSTFTAQSFSAFGTTVTILPAWGKHAQGMYEVYSIAASNSDLYAPTATFTTDVPGIYTVKLTATDAENNTNSTTMTVNVAETRCAGAQLAAGWPGFNTCDFDQDCDVDIEDFAKFSSSWLNNLNLTGQIAD